MKKRNNFLEAFKSYKKERKFYDKWINVRFCFNERTKKFSTYVYLSDSIIKYKLKINIIC